MPSERTPFLIWLEANSLNDISGLCDRLLALTRTKKNINVPGPGPGYERITLLKLEFYLALGGQAFGNL